MLRGSRDAAGGVPPLYATFLKDGTFATLPPFEVQGAATWKTPVVLFVHEYGFTPTPDVERVARAFRGAVLFGEVRVTEDDRSAHKLWTMRSLPIFAIISQHQSTTYPVGHTIAFVDHLWTFLRDAGVLQLPELEAE
jgi:hypothetical protein